MPTKEAQMPTTAETLDAEGRTTEQAGEARKTLLMALPTTERRLELAGVSTAVLEGGGGPPVVLLHEPGSFAAHWVRVLPDLVRTNRVIVPDLPGHGASGVGEAELNADRILDWVAGVVGLCDTPPVLVGHLGSGAIAARFAVERSGDIRGLVLVDALGLGAFRPMPLFALSLFRYVARPAERTYNGLMDRCTGDFAGLRAGLGELWEPFRAYTLDRARSAAGKAALRVIMRELAVPQIPAAGLERISVPTTLIWGREDPVARLRAAEAASERYGWALQVIEDVGDDAPLEHPEAFLRALRTALAIPPQVPE
jgi:pimeloyl-ACP methyl ester carboxylesterase